MIQVRPSTTADAPAPGRPLAGEQGDCVFVRGLEFEASHGYTAAERRATRRFRVSMTLWTPLRAPARSDRLSDTIDYWRVCEIATRVGTESTFKLLEKLAAKIAESVQDTYPASQITVELEKLAPPCPGCPESCGVQMTFAPRDAS